LSQGRSVHPDVAAVFHCVLFAYQKAQRDILGEASSSIVVDQVVPIIESILGKAASGLVNSKDADDALRKLSQFLVASGLVEKVEIKRGVGRYHMDIDGCMFAEHVHDLLKPKDVTCPLAVFAMAIAQKTGKQKAKISPSEITPKGAKTTIEL
jgi:hypothetical protein